MESLTFDQPLGSDSEIDALPLTVSTVRLDIH